MGSDSGDFLHSLVKDLPGFVYRCRHDSDWTMLYLSDPVESVTGYAPDELQDNHGCSYGDLIHPDDRDRVRQEVEQALEKNEPFDLEYRLITRNGETRWVHEQGRAVSAKEDAPPMLQGFVQDITRRKRREQQLEWAQHRLKESNEELQKQSREDALTGLSNKRHFTEILEREWRRHRRNKKTLSLIMADIDEFKRYNDTHGHEAGDKVLRAIGDALRTVVDRPGDFPARWGGEELALILSETDSEGARIVAEQTRKAVQVLGMPHPTSTPGDDVTMSFGAATMQPDDDHEPTDLVKRADEALYRSKKAGKDQVSVFEEAPTA